MILIPARLENALSLKLFLFDCDGTLVDTERRIFDCMVFAFQKNGFDAPSPDMVRAIVGLSLSQSIASIQPGLSAAQLDCLVSDYRAYAIEARKDGEAEGPLYDGALEVIKALFEHDDVLLGIATGRAYMGVVHLFDCHDLHAYFTSIQTADRAPSKPNPGMVLQAMSETGVAPEHTVMIGDSRYDMEMARAAKVHAVGVNWGYHSAEDLKAAGAHYLVDDYAALGSLLLGQFC